MMPSRNLFFDLDGTLIDAGQRLFQLFNNLVPESSFTFEEYWNLKRNQIGHSAILQNHFQYSDQQIDVFEKDWMEKIEAEEWLALDKPFEGVTGFLKKLGAENNLFIVTARQSVDAVTKQVGSFGWNGLFKNIFITQHLREKAAMISDAVEYSKQDWVIGDTGMDILTGKKLDMKTAAVLTGFRNREALEKYQPDFILNSVLDLEQVVQ
jgi:phosphoglycolate phosphatase